MKKLVVSLVVLLLASSVFAAAADLPSASATDIVISNNVVTSDITTNTSKIADTHGDDSFVDLSVLDGLSPAFANIVLKGLISEGGALIVEESVIPEKFDIIAVVKDSAIRVIPYAAREAAEEEVKTNLEIAYEEISVAEKVEDLFDEDQKIKAPEGTAFVVTELFAYDFTDAVVKLLDENENSYFVISLVYSENLQTPFVAVRAEDGTWLKGFVKRNSDGTITLYLPAEGPIIFMEAHKI